jgi:PKD repeat protein
MLILKTMKNIIYLSLVLPIMLLSCERSPEAHFYTDTVEPEVGQEVFFTNESHNAVDFEWDFGDGFISDAVNPVHVFTGTGTFEVILTAYSGSGLSDKASITIEVMIPTLLEIEVVEYNDEYGVAGASVRLYPTLPDWDDQTNMTSEGYTDEEGFIVFSHLGPYVYYVDVWEQNHDNVTLREEDVGFIRTPEILPHKINRFVAWVDYTGTRKGVAAHDRSFIIKKLERKADQKAQIPTMTTIDNWQYLYSRSIKIK